MKRLLAAALLAVLITGVCVAEHVVTDGFEKSAWELVTKVKTARNNGNYKSSNDSTDQLIRLFEENEVVLSLFTNKEIVDDIERSIYRISDFGKGDDDVILLSEISMLETELKELARTSGVFINSVF